MQVSNKVYFYLSGIALIICSYFSEGFLHVDEHFQILEFINYKLGLTPLVDLAWEFPAKIRPWIQPFFYYHLVKFFSFLGINSPFTWAWLLRLTTVALTITNFYFVKKYFSKKVFLLTIFFYPLIYLGARLSSEAVGGAIFYLAYIFLTYEDSKDSKTQILTGALLALSFYIRFQIGIMIAALALHEILINKISFKRFSNICIGFFSVVAICLLIDKWGYGEYAFSPWNYLYQNLVLGKASGYGVSPFYDYFIQIFRKLPFPIGALLIFSHIYYWVKRPKDPITWTTLSFFIVHSMIGHKETRFLFPMCWFAPIIFKYTLDQFQKFKITKYALYLTIVVNLAIFSIVLFRRAHISIDYFRYLSKNPITKVYVLGNTFPFYLAKLKFNFYNKIRPIEIPLESSKNLSVVKEDTFYVFASRGNQFFDINEHKNCNILYSSYPSWVLNYNIGNWIKRSKFWSLHKCTK